MNTDGREEQNDRLVTAGEARNVGIEHAAFFRDPQFQTFYQSALRDRAMLQGFFSVLNEGRYQIPEDDLETLRSIRDDAFALYDVVYGKRPVTDFLSAVERFGKPEVFGAMLVELYRYFRPRLAELTLAIRPESERLQ